MTNPAPNNDAAANAAPTQPAGDGGLKRAMETIRRLRGELADRDRTGPIAIVGAGLRLPGSITSLEAYWAAMEAGRHFLHTMPADRRWPFEREWALLPTIGGYLDDVLGFDPGFFGVSPKEALAIDPQHRVLLEVVSEALDHAALPPHALRDAVVATYVGISGRQDYADWTAGDVNSHWATGNGNSFAAGRIAYALGFTGAALATDTACSSSLVSIHLAVQALRHAECDVALAGGVNLVLAPASTRIISTTRSLAPDGLCKSFDARANGFARGEGAAVVVLKRLADAERDHDRILGVIHGSAVNQDGRSSGFTAPNVLAQARVIDAALADARCSPADIGLVEAHGTGTALGDPIEMSALVDVLGRRNGGRELHVGSMKANFGHLEAAAGVVGVLKALLCVRERRIPPLAHFRTLNPRIDLAGTEIRISDEASEWSLQRSGGLAGVSSFGMVGTNAHLVIGPAPTRELPESAAEAPSRFAFSAGDDAALRAHAATLAEHLDGMSPREFAGAAYTATFGRAHHACHAVVDACGAAEAVAALQDFAAGVSTSHVTTGSGATSTPRPGQDGFARKRVVIDLPPVPWRRVRCAPARPATAAGSSAETEVAADGDVAERAVGETVAPSTGLLELVWQPAAPGVREIPHTLLIAGDDPALIDALVRAAGAAGIAGSVLGDHDASAADGWSTGALPRDDASWEAALDSPNVLILLALRGDELAHDLAAAAAAANDGATPATLAARLCMSVTTAVRALQRSSSSGRVVALTRGVRPVAEGDEVRATTQSVLHGLGAVLGLELRDSWGGVVDLPAQPTDADAAAAIRAACGSGDEDVVAIRAAEALAPRIVAAGSKVRPRLTVVDDATYVITGGGGGIGAEIAAYLERRGARHLVLIGRRPEEGLSAAVREQLREQRGRGTVVRYVQADCADPAALAAAWTCLDELPTLRGVVHAAGTLPEAGLRTAVASDFEDALAAKYAGAWWLHLLTKGAPLDFLVSTSSVSALWGHEGRGAYSAANAGIDAIAAHRRSLGLPALAIDFGAWGLDGMLDEHGRERLARIGMTALTPAEGCASLSDAGPGGAATMMACSVDWPRFTDVMDTIRRRSLFDRLRADANRARDHGDAFALAGASPTAVTGAVRALLAAVLGHDDPKAIDDRTGFFDLGLDSIMAVDFARSVAEASGADVQVTHVFDHATVERLAAHVRSEMLAARPEPRLDAPAPTASAAHAVTMAGDDRHEPVAIIGMEGRFPGAGSIEELWQLLDDGVDAVGPVPAGRWNGASLLAGRGHDRGRITTDQGGFLDDIESFDAAFFGIPRREALSMDPQHRLLLETAWHALEQSGTAPDRLAGTKTGVFVGISNSDYARVLARGGLGGLDAYFASGTALNAAAGRISYLLGLTGPAMAVDTACSSSLVSLHLAIRSLRSGECEQAIVGGVNVIATPECSVAVSQAHMLSPDGRCKPFSAAANGFVRAEACGVLHLKLLREAQRCGDSVLAVVHGSAINQDGASAGLTVPSGAAQTAVIEAALDDAGVSPRDIGYLEAHGTGTALGDPIEAAAAWKALSPGRDRADRLLIGSVKSNIGHAESAAGIVGVIKAVLALQHERIPASLHGEELNPRIDWGSHGLGVVDRSTAWERSRAPRLAGVSSFGFSGTNAHVVVGEAPLPNSAAVTAGAGGSGSGLVVLPLSADDAAGYNRLRTAWEPRLGAAADLGDIRRQAVTAARGRSHRRLRRALVFDSLDGLSELWAENRAPVATERPAEVAFVFPGTVDECRGLGRTLYEDEPAFRDAVDRCAEALRPALGADLRDVLLRDAPSPDGPGGDHGPLAAVVLGVGLAELWQRWGVTPSVVLGHGAGEISAAIVAGTIDFQAGMSLAAARSTLVPAELAGGRAEASAHPHASPSGDDGAAGQGPARAGAIALVSSLGGCAAGVAVALGQGRVFVPDRGQVVGDLRSLDGGGCERDALLACAARLYELGHDIRWDEIYPASRHPGAPAPRSPFAPTRHWPDMPDAAQPDAPSATAREPHWGRELRSPAIAGRVFAFGRSPSAPSYLDDHRIDGTVVVPASSHLSTILSSLASDGARLTLEDLVCTDPLVVAEGEERHAQLLTEPTSPGVDGVTIVSDSGAPDATWRTHLSARLVPAPESAADRWPVVDADAMMRSAERSVDGAGFYAYFRDLGYTLGPSFRWISQAWIASDEALVRFEVPPLPDDLADYEVHPGLIDSCFQTAATFMVSDVANPETSVAIPFSMRRISFRGRPIPGAALWARIRIRESQPLPAGRRRVGRADVQLWNDPANPILVVEDLRLRHASRASLRRSGPAPGCYATEWADARTAAEVAASFGPHTPWRTVAVVNGRGLPARRIKAAMQFAGHVVVDAAVPSGRADVSPELIVDVRFACLEAPTDAAAVSLECAQLTRDLARANPAVPYVVVLDGRPSEAPLTAAVEGMIACLSVESPRRRVLPVTVDGPWDIVAFAAAVSRALDPQDVETAVRVTGACERVRRLAPLAGDESDVQVGDASVLITGGFGALGLSLARLLVRDGARKLVLFGRSEPNENARRVCSELESAGATIVAQVGDVTSGDDCQRAVSTAQALAPLRAVYHLAGSLFDRRLGELEQSDFAGAFAAKCTGADALVAACGDLELRTLVLFSSAAATLGSAGQISYGAANGYLNGRAAQLRTAGLPAVAIGWGPWVPSDGAGMVAGSRVLERAAKVGIAPLDDEAAWELLRIARASTAPATLAVCLDPDGYRAGMSSNPLRSLVDGLTGSLVPAPAGGSAGDAAGASSRARAERPGGWLREELAALSPMRRAQRLRTFIRSEIARVLGEDDDYLAAIDDGRGFEDSGLDSIMMLEIGEVLAAALDVSLVPTVAMDYASVGALADHLLAETPIDPPTPSAPDEADRERPERDLPREAVPADARGHALEDLADEELLQAIERELGRGV